MSGHLGRIGGRQVVAVLALGGGLLLGPVLPGVPADRAVEDGTSGAGDRGPVATSPDAAQAGLAAPGFTFPDLTASGLEPVRHGPGPVPGAGHRFTGAG
ncbi:hypothetical protein [Streptomyces anandii]|uniref:hypothetical protein n=1 Tax=Streptomyces anandii TaxID=285454 RepID=UPI0016757F02|nr:hypothetical protein [Streptomyces anandii]GGY14334.1 hypothetical protein GCM10010510_70320 [Streptomyces anandii JCM 4720]